MHVSARRQIAGVDSAIGRLSSIVDDATAATLESYKYLGLGTIVERVQPEAQVKLTYVRQPGDALAVGDGGDQYTGLDRFGRVIDQNWVRTSASAGGAAAGTSTARLQYGYDRDDNALFRHDLVFEALDDLYQYDGLNRLASYKRGVLSRSTPGGPLDTVATPYNQQSWSLDAQGNWGSFTADGSTTTKTFNSGNQTTSVSGGTAPTYDANGNATAKGGRSFVYDAWNRLVAVKNGATTIASYAYDALRRRIKETAGSATTDVYFTPGSQAIEEQTGATTYLYVYGASGAMTLRDVYASGSLQSAWRLYAQRDANGDVVALVSGAGAAGEVQERYWYTPYGSSFVLAGDGTGRAASYHGWRFYFHGGRLDSATGLYAFGLRDYDPASGAWMERDPIGLAGGDPNLYRFVASNPVTWIDPAGLLRLFGQSFVMPWDPNAAGVGETLNAYGRAAGYAADATGGFVHGVARGVVEPFGYHPRGAARFGNPGAFDDGLAAGKSAATVGESYMSAAGIATAIAAAGGGGTGGALAGAGIIGAGALAAPALFVGGAVVGAGGLYMACSNAAAGPPHGDHGAPGGGSTNGASKASTGAKRGPKTDPTAPHNATIRSEAQKLEAEGNRILAGGGRREQLIRTPGGVRGGRRPDILYRTPDGQLRGRNVGKTMADGSPVPREVDALNDLNGPGNLPTDFVPYDR